MWWKWLPWRFMVRRFARAHGFLDPLAVMGRLRRFAQPSEVAEPIELLRAGVVFHARGLINSRVIQHNRDWVWPYWAERQFDPADKAFIPRAFSITHVNLSHRNWTAVGLPDGEATPIIDPRGLVTPLFDGWSLDAWVVADDGRVLLPSRSLTAVQTLDLDARDGLTVCTTTVRAGLELTTRAWATRVGEESQCRLSAEALCDGPGWLVLSLRPANPEGVAFIHRIDLDADRRGWTIDGDATVAFSEPAERHHVSDYRRGDVFIHLDDAEATGGECEIGMATAAALYRLEPDTPRRLIVTVPLEEEGRPSAGGWPRALEGHCRLSLPDARMTFLYDAAVRTLILHAPGDVYPGPYTYKRFWFRDAALILNALLCAGLIDRAERAIDRFPARQTRDGFFRSQEGEWDANGEVLWIIDRYCALSGRPPKPSWRRPIARGAAWLVAKRLPDDGSPHGGLLPAGFSAEHLGPNDYYYWDDFWAVGGLRAAARLMERYGLKESAASWEAEADAFQAAVDRSLARVAERLKSPAIPASPYRRLDAGAIGSLAGGFPLQILAPDDPRLLATNEFLITNCLVDGGFFQDVVHSGINAYLTLHMAQVALRAGDPRAADLMRATARLASPTGQWPEAIHPHTGGGCMGDGQHVWAAAEWVMMLRNAFVREEGATLVIGAGLLPEWLVEGAELTFGPAPTAFGTLSLTVAVRGGRAHVDWTAEWRGAPPRLNIALPGLPRHGVSGADGRAEVGVPA
ncbi:hypothetical protein ACM64Y_12805 [Novispirillum sp. DQ9]|uniref:hypothetical protein n=1 Tax=Novispirillum sp. DQ9 TaxID=3398612 RepID=UPI003C7ABCD8